MILSLLRNKTVPLRLRKKIGKLYNIPDHKAFEIKMFNQTYPGTTGTHLDNKVYLYGLHEASTIHLMRKILDGQRSQGQKTVYLDIGTNVGMHLIALADLCDQAYGFEPWDVVRQTAQSKIAFNNLTDTIEVLDFGLSDSNQTLSFLAPQHNNTGVGSFLREDEKRPENGSDTTLSLSVRKGDDFVQEKNIQPTLLKLDIEGHEKPALTGLKKTLETHKPAVIFEYSKDSKQDLGSQSLLKELFGGTYNFYGIHRSREFPKLTPFNPDKKYENVLAYPGLYKI